MNTTAPHILLLLTCLSFVSCGLLKKEAEIVEPKKEEPAKAVYHNPFPAGTYNHHLNRQDYPKTYKIYRDEAGLAAMKPSEARIVIDLSDQRGRLYQGSKVVLDYPIATGKTGNETPVGRFTITEKIQDKRSNLYGKILNADGAVVKGDADARKDPVPEGGKFLGAPMPYWMRLTSTGIGMHQGRVPRYPASHGCIRHTNSAVTTIFSKVKVGTPVVIQK